ncbi:MAG: J domain-containing protein [Anaerolineae bacterium]
MTVFDYYDLLGVPETASIDEIKHAYRRIVRATHPDVNPTAEAEALFKGANEAYTVLSNPIARADYDRARAFMMSPTAAGALRRPAPPPPPPQPRPAPPDIRYTPRMERSLGLLRELSLILGAFLLAFVGLMLLSSWDTQRDLRLLADSAFLLSMVTVVGGVAVPIWWLLSRRA